MRTLVLGLPLPHVSFDNYSFLSAPSLFDYDRIVVEISALSQAIRRAVDSPSLQKTFAGQTIVNGHSGPDTFSLAELLRLRRLEAERFLARGGVIACFAYPDPPHPGIQGLPDWRPWDWLPAPTGFTFATQLLAGYGKLGVNLAEDDHPFAPYVRQFGVRLAFRAYVSEDAPGFPEYGRVFARSPGGAAVGVDLAVGRGRILLLPPLGSLDYDKDRVPLAGTLHECFERMTTGQRHQRPQWIRKEAS